MTNRIRRALQIDALIPVLLFAGAFSLITPRRLEAGSCTVPLPHCAVSFTDTSSASCQIATVASAGVMPGCGGGLFCPSDVVTRGAMAVFLESAKHYTDTNSSTFTATGVFTDVPSSFPLACWIEQLWRDGITAGCGASPMRYCPDQPVTRSQMAVFILKTKYGSTFVPPACTGIFGDVPCPTGFAVNWIEKLANDCVTAGCGGGNYCPDNSISRAEMAVFLYKAFLIPSACTNGGCPQ